MEEARSETIIATIRPGLHITQTCFRVGSRHFELDAIDDLEARQAARHPLTRNALLLAGMCLLALIFLGRFMHPAGIVAIVLVLCGLLVVAAISAQHRSRQVQLWARYRGRITLLFATEDPWLFGAVERQLHRSIVEVRRGKTQLPNRPYPAVPHPSQMHPSRFSPGSMRM